MYAQVSKETYSYGKRDLFTVSKETYSYGKRGLRILACILRLARQCQKRPMYMAKEAYSVSKETYIYGKRGLLTLTHLSPDHIVRTDRIAAEIFLVRKRRRHVRRVVFVLP